METKSKHMLGRPFSVDVCDNIRHHQGEINKYESKRKNAFGDRDAALADKRGLRNKSSVEYAQACQRHSDAVVSIIDLSAQIKWHREQLKDVVADADNSQLALEYEPPEPKVPAPKAEKPAKGEKSPKPEKKADEKPAALKLAGGTDSRPVGRRPRSETPAPLAGEGVNEHLSASVNELDCREDLKSKLIKSGLTTVAEVIQKAEKSADPVAELQAVTELADTAVRAIWNSVQKFRSAHRKADLAVSGANA